nr:glycosyltransferase [Pseudomonas sp. MF6787]
MELNVHFFGVTRFSIYNPGSKAWAFSQQSESEYLEGLYSDERMAPRVEIFINKSLPIYQSMADKYSYKHILLYSEILPEKWKNALELAAERFPVLVLVKDGTKHSAPMLEFLSGKESSSIAWFRVDDDDLLSSDYLDQLSSYVKPEFEGMAVSFGAGLAAYYSDGSFKHFRKCRFPLLALGQAFIGRYDAKKGALDFPSGGDHTSIDMRTPVILDSRRPTYVWTHHSSQDTKLKKDKVAVISTVNSILSKMPPAENCTSLIDIFPTMAGDFIAHDAIGGVVFDSGDRQDNLTGSFTCIDASLGAGAYTVEYNLQCSESSVNDRAALLSFSFEGKEDFVIGGLSLADREDIGLYRYLETGNENNIGRFDIFIPFGVSLTSLKVMSWQCAPETAQLNGIKIYSRDGIC